MLETMWVCVLVFCSMVSGLVATIVYMFGFFLLERRIVVDSGFSRLSCLKDSSNDLFMLYSLKCPRFMSVSIPLVGCGRRKIDYTEEVSAVRFCVFSLIAEYM